MLPLEVKQEEFWDERTETFLSVPTITLRLEHSLISLSKWEARWKKPFLKTFENTLNVGAEEWIDYIRCMTINPGVPDTTYLAITNEQMQQIYAYMNDPMTATWFNDKRPKKASSKKRTTTAEVIYFKMTQLGIPFECEKWHLNRLMTLIRTCEEMGAPPQKMGQREAALDNARINAMRRRSLRSRG